MSPIRVGINGFGRIGRALAWILLQDKRFEVAAINDVAAPEIMAHLYRFDSIHGRRAEQSDFAADRLIIDGKPISYSRHLQPKDISWDVHDVQFVVECTGQFKTRTSLQEHLKPGVQRVLLSVPPEDDSIPTLVMGINEHLLSPEDRIISNASCTTNNAAPMIQLIDELCGIESCYITTVHSYTGDQRLHDSPHHDLRPAEVHCNRLFQRPRALLKRSRVCFRIFMIKWEAADFAYLFRMAPLPTSPAM